MSQLLESPHGAILNIGVRHPGCVAELHLGYKHLGAGTNSTSNDEFLDDALDVIDDPVLLNSTNFTKKYEYLAIRVLLIAQEMVNIKLVTG